MYESPGEKTEFKAENNARMWNRISFFRLYCWVDFAAILNQNYLRKIREDGQIFSAIT